MLYQKILYHSEVGNLTVVSDNHYIRKITFGKGGLHPGAEWCDNHPLLVQAELQLTEYFNGTRRYFTLPIAVDGTPFQKAVWNALLEIPYGETVTYGDLAKKIDKPNASRAVGGGCNKNPIVIVIPCHRVIGVNGNLTGFAGGITVKENLLALERKFQTNG